MAADSTPGLPQQSIRMRTGRASCLATGASSYIWPGSNRHSLFKSRLYGRAGSAWEFQAAMGRANPNGRCGSAGRSLWRDVGSRLGVTVTRQIFLKTGFKFAKAAFEFPLLP